MPVTSKTQAKNEMLSVYKAVADAQGIVVSIYPNSTTSKPEAESVDAWAIVQINDTSKPRASIGSANGSKRYRTEGFLMIELFTNYGEGTTESETISDAIESAYRGGATDGGINFKDPVTVEGRNDTNWYKVTILIQYYYDTIQ